MFVLFIIETYVVLYCFLSDTYVVLYCFLSETYDVCIVFSVRLTMFVLFSQ